MITAILIFALTYLIICGRRLHFIKLGRPAGVLLGAVLMVAARVITPAQAYELVNWNTIVLLLGMMIIIEHLADAEFFELIAGWILGRGLSSRGLLAVVVFLIGSLAAFLVNDIVCIFFTPLLLVMMRRRSLPPLPFLLALATSANLGGLIAFTGNPQNMIIGHLSGISYARFFVLMLPVGLLTLAVNYALLVWMYRKELDKADGHPAAKEDIPSPKPLLKRSLLVTALVIAGFFAGGNMAWVALAGATLLLLLARREEVAVLSRIDWNLLVFFAGLFVVVGALSRSGATAYIAAAADRYIHGQSIGSFWAFGAISVVCSNLFSNVPYVLVAAEWVEQLPDPTLMWYILAFASTVAGNLTILGSVANVIVVERARGACDIGFGDFLRFGVPSTVLNFVVGMAFLTLYHLFGWI